MSLRGAVDVPAPALFLRSQHDSPSAEVPLADLVWRLHLPQGYEVVRTGGTVVPIDGDRVQKPAPALVEVAGVLYLLAGGVHPLYGSLSAARESARCAATMNEYKQSRPEDEPVGAEGATDIDLQTTPR